MIANSTKTVLATRSSVMVSIKQKKIPFNVVARANKNGIILNTFALDTLSNNKYTDFSDVTIEG